MFVRPGGGRVPRMLTPVSIQTSDLDGSSDPSGSTPTTTPTTTSSHQRQTIQISPALVTPTSSNHQLSSASPTSSPPRSSAFLPVEPTLPPRQFSIGLDYSTTDVTEQESRTATSSSISSSNRPDPVGSRYDVPAVVNNDTDRVGAIWNTRGRHYIMPPEDRRGGGSDENSTIIVGGTPGEEESRGNDGTTSTVLVDGNDVVVANEIPTVNAQLVKSVDEEQQQLQQIYGRGYAYSPREAEAQHYNQSSASSSQGPPQVSRRGKKCRKQLLIGIGLFAFMIVSVVIGAVTYSMISKDDDNDDEQQSSNDESGKPSQEVIPEGSLPTDDVAFDGDGVATNEVPSNDLTTNPPPKATTPTQSPTHSPTVAPTPLAPRSERMIMFGNWLVDNDISDNQNNELFVDVDSPQYQALNWIVDKFRNPPPLSSASTMASILIDTYVLALIYFSTNGQNWTNRTNWLRIDGYTCSWYGVSCYDDTNLDGQQQQPAIRELQLGNNSLVGSIPRAIGFLSSLDRLNFAHNELGGSIPSEVNLLLNLKQLELSENNFVGAIPTGIGNLNSLTSLNFGGNSFTNLPTEIWQLTSLGRLILTRNSFQTSLPREVGQLTSLEVLSIDEGGFVGNLPTEIGLLTGLIRFTAWQNELAGNLHAEIGMLTSLTVLTLSFNKFAGRIPSEIGHLKSLVDLRLDNNFFGGNLPSEIGDLTGLTRLVLAHNSLSGTVPTEIGKLTNMVKLNLEGNEFTSIPIQLIQLLAVPIDIGQQNLIGTTIGASYETGLRCDDYTPYRGKVKWYSLIGTGSTIEVSTCHEGTTYDTLLTVFTESTSSTTTAGGSSSNVECIVENDDSCINSLSTGGSRVTWLSEIGRIYYILLSGVGEIGGDYEISFVEL